MSEESLEDLKNVAGSPMYGLLFLTVAARQIADPKGLTKSNRVWAKGLMQRALLQSSPGTKSILKYRQAVYYTAKPGRQ